VILVAFPVGLLLLVCALARVNRRVTRDPNFPFGYTFGGPETRIDREEDQ
jgi:hypothetical protein